MVNFNTQPFFNITAYRGSLKSVGTLMHIIAYGYVMAIIGIVAVSLRKSSWLLVILPLLLYIGVKGALMLLALSLFSRTVVEPGFTAIQDDRAGVLRRCALVGTTGMVQ